jgi:L-asparaginase II
VLETLTVADAVELAVVERSGFVESRHAGAAIVLSPDGEVVRRLGNPEALFLPRSSLKPLQAIACITAGAELAGEQLALATASHVGTDRHACLARRRGDAGRARPRTRAARADPYELLGQARRDAARLRRGRLAH